MKTAIALFAAISMALPARADWCERALGRTSRPAASAGPAAAAEPAPKRFARVRGLLNAVDLGLATLAGTVAYVAPDQGRPVVAALLVTIAWRAFLKWRGVRAGGDTRGHGADPKRTATNAEITVLTLAPTAAPLSLGPDEPPRSPPTLPETLVATTLEVSASAATALVTPEDAADPHLDVAAPDVNYRGPSLSPRLIRSLIRSTGAVVITTMLSHGLAAAPATVEPTHELARSVPTHVRWTTAPDGGSTLTLAPRSVTPALRGALDRHEDETIIDAEYDVVVEDVQLTFRRRELAYVEPEIMRVRTLILTPRAFSASSSANAPATVDEEFDEASIPPAALEFGGGNLRLIRLPALAPGRSVAVRPTDQQVAPDISSGTALLMIAFDTGLDPRAVSSPFVIDVDWAQSHRALATTSHASAVDPGIGLILVQVVLHPPAVARETRPGEPSRRALARGGWTRPDAIIDAEYELVTATYLEGRSNDPLRITFRPTTARASTKVFALSTADEPRGLIWSRGDDRVRPEFTPWTSRVPPRPIVFEVEAAPGSVIPADGTSELLRLPAPRSDEVSARNESWFTLDPARGAFTRVDQELGEIQSPATEGPVALEASPAPFPVASAPGAATITPESAATAPPTGPLPKPATRLARLRSGVATALLAALFGGVVDPNPSPIESPSITRARVAAAVNIDDTPAASLPPARPTDGAPTPNSAAQPNLVERPSELPPVSGPAPHVTPGVAKVQTDLIPPDDQLVREKLDAPSRAAPTGTVTVTGGESKPPEPSPAARASVVETPAETSNTTPRAAATEVHGEVSPDAPAIAIKRDPTSASSYAFTPAANWGTGPSRLNPPPEAREIAIPPTMFAYDQPGTPPRLAPVAKVPAPPASPGRADVLYSAETAAWLEHHPKASEVLATMIHHGVTTGSRPGIKVRKARSAAYAGAIYAVRVDARMRAALIRVADTWQVLFVVPRDVFDARARAAHPLAE